MSRSGCAVLCDLLPEVRRFIDCQRSETDFVGISYAHLKKDVFHEGRDGKKLGYGEALAAAAIAGMPAAYLTTPFVQSLFTFLDHD